MTRVYIPICVKTKLGYEGGPSGYYLRQPGDDRDGPLIVEPGERAYPRRATMPNNGYYYLHENGELIWKRCRPEAEAGGFVKRVWPVDTTDRRTAWAIILESLGLGAKLAKVKELAKKWGCDTHDLTEYLARCPGATEERREGLRRYLPDVLGIDFDEWMEWLGSTPKGHALDWESMPRSELSMPF